MLLVVDVGTSMVKWGTIANDGAHAEDVGLVPAPESLDELWELMQEIIGRYRPDTMSGLVITGRMGEVVIRYTDGTETWVKIGAELEVQYRYSSASFGETGYDHRMAYFRSWCKQHGLKTSGNVSFLLPLKDWLVWKITGTVGTDISNAGAMGFLDIERRAWNQKWCRWAGIDMGVLPPIQPMKTIVGGGAALRRQYRQVPVYRGCGDGVAGVLGFGQVSYQNRYVNLGTHLVVRAIYPRRPQLRPGAPRFCYPLEGVGYVAGYRLDWAGRPSGYNGEPKLSRDAVAAQPDPKGTNKQVECERVSIETSWGVLIKRIVRVLAMLQPEGDPDQVLRVTGGLSESNDLVDRLTKVLGRPLLVGGHEATLIGAATSTGLTRPNGSCPIRLVHPSGNLK